MKRIKLLSIMVAFCLIIGIVASLNSRVFANEIDMGEIDSISYTPKEEYEFVENTNGTWCTEVDSSGETVKYYYYSGCGFHEGDVLTINKKDDSKISYTFYNGYYDDQYKYGFYSEDGNEIDTQDLDICTNQDGNHWSVGNENCFTITYANSFTVQVPVTIIENPISSIEYEPITPYEKIENTQGYWTTKEVWNSETSEYETEEYYEYYISLQQGDKLILNNKDGSRVEYTYDCSGEKTGFYNTEGDCIDTIGYETDQYATHWIVGDNNYFTFKYMGHEVQVPVTILENPVESIEYTPVTPYEFIDKVNVKIQTSGYYDENNEWVETERLYFYRYEYKPGDILTVHKKDGTTVNYTYYQQDEKNGFYSEDESYISTEEVYCHDTQYENQWTIDGENYFIVSYLGYSTNVPVTIIENPISTIEFTPIEKIELIENVKGYWNTNEAGTEKYFLYNFGYFKAGDILKINYKNGTEETYVFCDEDNKYGFYNGDKKIDTDDVTFTSNQYKEHWTVGDNNYAIIEYMNIQTQVQVTITENLVSSIEYTPIEVYQLIENTKGNWSTSNKWNEEKQEYEEEEFYYYSLYNLRDKEGDILTVNYKDGTSSDYTFYNSGRKYGFYDENGKYLSVDEVTKESNQYDEHWIVGDNNYFTFKYMGHEVQVPVTILENPVETIEFIPNEPIELFENANGYWSENSYYDENDEYITEQYYNYEYDYQNGDILKVNYKDGTNKNYIFNSKRNDFYDEEGNLIEKDEVNYESNQYLSHWTKDSENYFTITYMGHSTEVKVTIIDNPVESIEFIPDTPYEFIENAGGYWGTIDGNEETKYYHYYWSLYEKGNKLKVNKNDGTTIIYTYSEEDSGFYFIDDNGEIAKDIRYYNEQESNHWTIDGDNYFTVEYMGRTTNVPVTIKENLVESIEFKTNTPYEIIENTNGSWSTSNKWNEEKQEYEEEEYYSYYYRYPQKGDTLTVNYKDGTTVDYTYGYKDELGYFSESGEKISSGEVIFNSNQYENHWMIDGNNYYTVSYMGQTTRLPVIIKENLVKAIEFTPVAPYEFIENTKGYWSTRNVWDSENDEYKEVRYYCYNCYWQKGDILKVTKKDGTETTYKYENEEKYGFYSESGEKLDTSELYIDSDQDNNPWTVGGENYNTITYMGYEVKIPVSIIESYVDTIEYTPIKPYKFVENLNGYWKTEQNDNNEEEKYFYYYGCYYREGDILKVNKKDGTSTSYEFYCDEEKYGFYSNNGEELDFSYLSIEENQNTKHWTLGNDNYFTIVYMGKSVQIPVTIIENVVESIEYTPINTFEFVENTTGSWEEAYYWDEEKEDYCPREIFIYRYGFNEGDILTVNKKDGTIVNYTFKKNEDISKSGFYSTDGDLIVVNDDIYFYDNQYEEPWTVDGDNYFIVVYMGNELKVPVKIIECQHTIVVKNSKKATCTQEGYTGDKICSICGKTIEKGVKINKISHTANTPVVTQVNPTYTSKGSKTTITKCKVCGTVISKKVVEIPMKARIKSSTLKISLSKTSYKYDGKSKKPSVIVKDKNGKTISSKYYTVNYASGRKSVGKYAVKVTFKDAYTGSKTLYFTINPKGTSISSLTSGSKKMTVNLKKQTSKTSGYEIQYSTSSKFTSSKSKKVKISNNKTTKKTISKLKGKKKYYVRVRTYKTVKFNGETIKIYSSWSKAKAITTKK